MKQGVMRAAGMRRTRVRVQAPTVAAEAGAGGGYTETWADLSPSNVWASVSSAGGDESLVGHVARASMSHVVEIDYHRQLNHKCRFVLGDRFLYVVALDNVDERNITHRAACEERA
jgi:head-tail adaptor